MVNRVINASVFYRIERWCYKHYLKPLALLIQGIIFLIYNSYIPYTCEIGKGTKFGYWGMGVVIHGRAKIGSHCIIAQQVTIGGRSKKPDVPVIGDHVYIGAGAKILGPVKIGNHVVIGANAVVLNDIPDHTAVAGVPARIIKQGIHMEDMI